MKYIQETEEGLKIGDVVVSQPFGFRTYELRYLIVKRTSKFVWYKEQLNNGRWSDEVTKTKIFGIN